MNEYKQRIKDELISYKDQFLKEIEQHKFMFKEFKLNWSLNIIQEESNRINASAHDIYHKLEFVVESWVNADKVEKRRVTILEHDVDDADFNILAVLRNVVFNFDYTKINDYFNTVKAWHA